MIKKNFFKKLRKGLNSIAVLTLLLPNIMSVGIVAAEELNSDEPQTENVEEIDTEETDLEVETDDTEPGDESIVEENETTAPQEPSIEEETSEAPIISQENPTEDAPVVIEETPQDTFAPTQIEEDELGEPREVNTYIHVRTPSNMNNYVNTLNDFETHPLILTNQVTGETFSTTIRPDDEITSNHFTLETTVHAYERGNQPSGRYTIALPQELIDLGYSLTRDHSVQSNFGIVGTTNLSYNAPQNNENVGELSRNILDYDFLDRQNIGITLTTLDGQRTYTLGSRNLSIPSGEYNIQITNTPTDSRPKLVLRESSLVNAPESEIELTQNGDAYVGTSTFDFTNSTRPQVFKLSPIPVESSHTVTIDPNGGTINDEYLQTEVIDGESYSLPLRSRAGLEIPGYTLVGFEVTEGILRDTEGNPLSEIPTFTSRNYTLESDVTLSAIWEETSGGFRVQLYDDVPSSQRERYALTLIAEDGTEYDLSSNQFGPGHRTWRVDDVPNGTYTLVIDGYNISEAEKFGQNDTTSDFVVNEDGTATVELEFVDNKSTTFIRYKVYGEPVETHPLGVEVRDLDGLRTSDVTIYVQNEDFVVFRGSFNEYAQWITDEELPIGEYTITLQTPENTYAVVQDTTQQHAIPTDRQNVFTILVNEETRGSLSRVFAAFQLVEMEFHLGVEIRRLDGRRTNDVTVYVQDEDFVVFEGSYNEYRQWLTDAELPAGEYTITLDTLDNTQAVINNTTSQYAVPTDRPNVFTIELNETNLGTSSAIYGAFQLEEMEFRLGVEVRGLDGKRTSDVGVTITNEESEVFEGTYNEYLQWRTEDELPVGEYIITLDTPEGTVAEINDFTGNYAFPTDVENVFTIQLNEANLGSSSAIYGSFQLVEVPVEIEQYFLGVEVRDLDNLRTSEVGIVVTNEDGEVFEGAFNDYLQWLTDEELPVGVYRITLTTPEGTRAMINDTVALQSAIATDEENVFTILVNTENKGSLSAVYGAFQLVEVDEEVPTDPEEPTEPEQPTVPEEPTVPENPATPEEPADAEEPSNPEKRSSNLPLTGVATSAAIGLGITTILSGLGIYAISKKRKDQ